MYKFEQDLINDTVIKPPNIVMAAIASSKDGTLLANSPNTFLPEYQGIKDCLDAFEDDTSGVAERGINFGCGAPVSVPGKIVEKKAMYGNDGHGGGCVVIKTKKSLLIVIYDSQPAQAARMSQEAADHLEDNGR